MKVYKIWKLLYLFHQAFLALYRTVLVNNSVCQNTGRMIVSKVLHYHQQAVYSIFL